jgi:hypothetical protein
METGAAQDRTETYEGSCHCGRVRFRVRGDLANTVDCNCSMCTKKGFLHLIVQPDAFQLLQGGDELTTYRFNTGVAKHTFCRHCGIHPFYVPRSHPDKIDVNVRCLAGVDAAQLTPRPFDGRNWEATMAARAASHAASGD